MKVHLVDGTYELFRHYYGVPKHKNSRGEEVGAARAVVASMFYLLAEGATHLGVATDHIIESFRNDLWAQYKTGAGIEPDLRSQFELLEEALSAAGFPVWAMVEYEADDALAAGAARCAADARIEQVVICTPDKDLAQCVVGDRVVQYDRRQRRIYNASSVVAKFGVPPSSIPDYLALVGDSADGYPGLPGWGAKATAAVLAQYFHLEKIPGNHIEWTVSVRSSSRLSETLFQNRELALLFRRLATLVIEGPVHCGVDDLKWQAPTSDFSKICERLEAPELLDRANAAMSSR